MPRCKIGERMLLNFYNSEMSRNDRVRSLIYERAIGFLH